MPKVNVEDLEKIKERQRTKFTLRVGGYRAKVTVHMGPCGIAAGAMRVMRAMMDELLRSERTDVIVKTSSCGGLCTREPLATVEIVNQAPVKYCDLTDRKMREIFRDHVLGGKPVEKYALAIGCENTY